MPSAPTAAVIRPATKVDREGVINLLRVQLREHGIAVQAPELATAIDGVLACPERGILFVATLQRVPVGVAYLSFTWALEHGGKTAWLEELYIVPEQRQKGIGQALLTAACEHATEQGCAAPSILKSMPPTSAPHTYIPARAFLLSTANAGYAGSSEHLIPAGVPITLDSDNPPMFAIDTSVQPFPFHLQHSR